MFKTWKVSIYIINTSDGESEETYRAVNEKEALAKFRSWAASYGNNAATKACMIVVYTPDGDMFRYEKIDNSKYIPTIE